MTVASRDTSIVHKPGKQELERGAIFWNSGDDDRKALSPAGSFTSEYYTLLVEGTNNWRVSQKKFGEPPISTKFLWWVHYLKAENLVANDRYWLHCKYRLMNL